MESHNINKVELRNLQMDDYDQLARSFKRIYGDEDVFWTRAQIKKLNTIFPEGQVVIVVDNRIVGCALSIIVDYNLVKGDHTYAQVTGNETFNTHNPNGNILYGIEVFIHPDFRGLRLARREAPAERQQPEDEAACHKNPERVIVARGRRRSLPGLPQGGRLCLLA